METIGKWWSRVINYSNSLFRGAVSSQNRSRIGARRFGVGKGIAWLWSHQFFRFLVVGVGNTAFGYGVYLLCLLIGIPYQAAVVISTILGIIFNFFTSGAIVFRNAMFGKIFGFFAVYGFTLIVNLVLLTVLVESGVSKALGQAMVLPIIVILSFLLNKFWVFRECA